MRNKVFGKKLNRNRRSRTALFRSLSKAMILNGSIKTTRAKALAVQKTLDGLMKLVAEESLRSRRDALSRLANDREATDMLFEKYASLAKSRKSGYTTIAQLTPRRGDSAEMLQVSWVPFEEPKPAVAEKKEKVKK